MNPPIIQREPGRAAEQTYDLIIVGGGIYGCALALESARCGLRPLLLERDDFGGATSWNSLRILHGGLRYLQHLDLHRFRTSVAERHWFMLHFPELIRPLRCLMPLYGKGLKRPAIFRAALRLNDVLSRRRNDGLGGEAQLPGGVILSPGEAQSLFPDIDSNGLRGCGQWHDAVMLSSERILIETLRWACACGTTALNYTQAMSLHVQDDHVAGVHAIDELTQESHTFTAPIVVNCAGPWSALIAKRFDRDLPYLFRPSLAFNMLLDHPPLSSAALALTPRKPGGRTYFLVPWKGRLLAGTYHAPFVGQPTHPQPSVHQIDDFLSDLNQAVPNLRLQREQVMRIQAGLIPAQAAEKAEPSRRVLIINHYQHRGPHGLFSVSGVKFTTARHVAQQTLQTIYPDKARYLSPQPGTERPDATSRAALTDALGLLNGESPQAVQQAAQLADNESAAHLDDLILRRCDWCGTDEQALAVAALLAAALGYDEARTQYETARLKQSLQRCAPAWRHLDVEAPR